MTTSVFRPFFRAAVTTAMACAMLVGFWQAARAQTISAGFQFNIDQNLIVLDGQANIRNLEAAIADLESDGGDTTALEHSLTLAEMNNYHMAAMCLPSVSVLSLRELPGLSLFNESDSNANITRFEITLSSASSEFIPFADGNPIYESIASGEYALFDMDEMVWQQVDPDQVAATANIVDGGKRLTVDFDNGGIQPGRDTTFNVRSDLGLHLADLFDENTLIEVIYENPDSGVTASSGARRLGDLDVPGPGIDEFNQALDDQLAGGVMPGTNHFLGSVEAFSTSTIFVVPEPASSLLLGCGLGCLCGSRRRRASFWLEQ